MRNEAPDTRPIVIKLRTPGSEWMHYRVAGHAIWTDVEFPAFPTQAPAASSHHPAEPSADRLADRLRTPNDGVRPAIRGEVDAWMCGRNRTVRYEFHDCDTLLHIEDLGTFAIESERLTAARLGEAGAHMPLDHAAEIALGPLLTPLLAELGIFCLHGSAILSSNGAVVFVGESGAGKSTLAAWLAHHQSGAVLIADDVVPVALRADRLVALTDYPQLKLSPGRQPVLSAAAVVPVDAVIVLHEPEASVSVNPRTGAGSAAVFNGHTVASRLFHPRLMAAHFAFCATAAASSRVYDLAYPREYAVLSNVATKLSAILG